MVAVPPLMPETTPAGLTVATAGVLVLHVPPAGVTVSVVVVAWQNDTAVVGLIVVGVANTVIVSRSKQPARPYEITAVPAATPVTTPAATVALAGVLLLHVPPGAEAVSGIVLPIQTELAGPLIVADGGLMTTVNVPDV
jgi:hypothetical protein